jgi:AAA ATPase domain
MIQTMALADARELVQSRFTESEIVIDELLIREYPEETVFIVHVPKTELANAAEIGNLLDQELQKEGFAGFVTVRSSSPAAAGVAPVRKETGVADLRAAELIALMSARARTSEAQPSLHYVLDAAANLEKVRARRHSLIFGRRGAGKTALMLEAKRRISDDGQVVVWLNVQTYRRETTERTALWVASRIGDAVASVLRSNLRERSLQEAANAVRNSIETLLGQQVVSANEVHRLVPPLQRLIQRFCESSGKTLYIFLDDFHYLRRAEQPELLDVLHSCVRDADAWLKIAAIRHFANWYKIDPPTGLQAGQDADAIDLDLTLQQPTRAKAFLEQVLSSFARHVGVERVAGLYGGEALDRLLLASGAVPRDYLVLAAGSLQHARSRGKSKLVGKQDVARAAGDIAQAKMAELEEDATSATGSAQRIIWGLKVLRDFCLEEKGVTFFQIDFKEKEQWVEAYSVVQSLMDVRLIHLVNASVSDVHRAGERSEVYMLDLSQFSGERLRRHLKVIDFSEGHVILRETGTTNPPRIGNTPRRLITILRGAPQFALRSLTENTALAS